jgi:glycosyltransferase involved in cell wall biosynthesis
MSLSVALATFNGEEFINAQLASLAAQTVLPDELVVCDDGSTDETVRLLERFRRDAPFPVHIHPNSERLGFAETFLRCAGICRGDVIAFCDQDDSWLTQKVERCSRELQQPGVLLAIHSSRLAAADLTPTRRLYPHIRRDRLEAPLAGDPWLAVRGMSMAFAAELVRAIDPARRPPSHYLDGKMNHDEWIYVLARGLGWISYVAEPLARYRQHGGNITGAAEQMRPGELLRTGATYYARRHEQAVALADIFGERAPAAASWYREQAAALERRLSVYDPQARARVRLRRLASLAAAGAYGRRTTGGFGLRGLARDAVMVALRRTG